MLLTDRLTLGLDGFHLRKALMASSPPRLFQVTDLSVSEILARSGLPKDVMAFHKSTEVSLLIAMVRAYYDGRTRQRQSPRQEHTGD